MRSTLFPLCAALLLGACSSAQTGKLTHAIPVSDKFAAGKIDWEGSLGTYSYQWGVTELNDEILICGVGQYSSANAKPLTRDVMRRASAKLGQESILTNLNFFAEVEANDDLTKQVANCSRTGTPVPAGSWEVVLSSPGGRINTGDR